MGTNFHTAWDNTTLFKGSSMGTVPSSLDQAITYLKNVIVHCDGNITWTPATGTLAWDNVLRILFVRSDGYTIQNTVAAGSIVVSDNEFAYVDLNETNNTALTVAKAAVTTGAASNFKAYNRLVLGYRNTLSDNFYPVNLRKPW